MDNATDQTWEKLLSDGRRKRDERASAPSREEHSGTSRTDGSTDTGDVELRTEIERDHDRILFCTPVRRMADKTQVFPLDRNDSVRNRLTHSHEVSNLARSMGVTLFHNYDVAKNVPNAGRNIPALLAAVGLVHDLGNPPFGHQGEAAIQSWFRDNAVKVAGGRNNRILKDDQYEDFLKFEGNAQTFRLVTRLQLLNDNFGLDLTYATLAAMMKYPVGSRETQAKSHVGKKKHGFFVSERKIAERVLNKVGLQFGARHPLAYVMEACDDIAYAVLDIEDAVKKGLASFSDLMAYLLYHGNNDSVIKELVAKSQEKHDEYRRQELSPSELNDVSMQRFRVFAVGIMMRAVTEAFVANQNSLLKGEQKEPLLKLSKASHLRELLGDFAKTYAFQHRSVLEIELHGYNTIRGLMDIFWEAIINTDPTDGKVRPDHPYHRYVYTRISENYRRAYTGPVDDVKDLPLRYRQCLLLTDMISGMTDSYAMNLLVELKSFKMEAKL
ncbi:dGTP triphosphohydrolase [Burkholderia ambifaria]|uniref:dGTP triphosphohydrolase n=1 Tax=Burkholderia ambifaria TaxID=152480 RepID=UPI00158BDF5F|nr:dNTP triphosphohydrolase [Burkholderia ambifaria]WDR90336.1 dNTP triphosphohydrolase [Burkholderia ambifaria]WDS03191.1 dNTP triphosphohydrolase [Burkholderia ambifaria]